MTESWCDEAKESLVEMTIVPRPSKELWVAWMETHACGQTPYPQRFSHNCEFGLVVAGYDLDYYKGR